MQFIQSFSSPGLDSFFEAVTMMGEDYFFILVFAAVFWCWDKKLGYRLGFAYVSSGLVNIGLKETIRAPRPIGQPGIRSFRLGTAGGYSFPSGHTQVTTTLWAVLMMRIRQRWMYVLGSVAIALVGLSRLYLGVHWPADVIGGLLVGFLWAFASNRLFDYMEASGNKKPMWYLVAVLLAGMFAFPTPDYFKVAGTVLALAVGYVIEPHYIKFSEAGSVGKQILKVSIGVLGLLLIKTGAKVVLPSVAFSDFVRYFLIGVWMTILAPIAFEKLGFTPPRTINGQDSTLNL